MARRPTAVAAVDPTDPWACPPEHPADPADQIRLLREEVIAAREETERQRVALAREHDTRIWLQQQLEALAAHVGCALPAPAIYLSPERQQPKRPHDLPF